MLKFLFTWSILFEPLLFFVFVGRSFIGIPIGLSRILQILVLLILIFRLVMKITKQLDSKLKVPNFRTPVYFYLAIYLLLLIFAGLIGLISGAYSLSGPYTQHNFLSSISGTLNSASIRPLFEYVIAIYYVVYLAILPKYIFTTKDDILKFFTLFIPIYTR